MSFDITRQSLLRTVFYFLLLFVLFSGREYLFMPVAAPPDGDGTIMPLQARLLRFLSAFPWTVPVLTFLLVFVDSFFLTRIIARNLIFLERTYMPSLIYLMVSLGYYAAAGSVITLAVAFLVMYAAESMILSYKRRAQFGYFFHAGVALGAAPLLYAPAAVFGILLPVGLGLFRKQWRDGAVALTGFLLPLFFTSYVYWGMGEPFSTVVRQIAAALTSEFPAKDFFHGQDPLWGYVLSGIFLTVLVVSLATFVRRRKKMRNRSFKAYLLFVWMLVAVATLFALPGRSLDMLPLAAVPLAMIVPTYFNRRTGLWPNLLYALMMFALLAYNLLPFIRFYQENGLR